VAILLIGRSILVEVASGIDKIVRQTISLGANYRGKRFPAFIVMLKSLGPAISRDIMEVEEDPIVNGKELVVEINDVDPLKYNIISHITNSGRKFCEATVYFFPEGLDFALMLVRSLLIRKAVSHHVFGYSKDFGLELCR
jgi:hypothetical protein